VFDAAGDHRMAMAAAIAAAAVPGPVGESSISGFGSVATSYPRFADHLEMLAAGARGTAS